MLMTSAADTEVVLNRTLVLTAFACCLVVLASFTMFARDQMAGASVHQQTELGVGASSSPGSARPHHREGQPGRFINGAASALTSPFRSIIKTDNQWVQHGFPAICALLLYGGGLGFLARFSRGLS